VQSSRVCTSSYLSTGVSNLLQPAQAEVVLGQLSTYLASWVIALGGGRAVPENRESLVFVPGPGGGGGGVWGDGVISESGVM
jgi:hypothetical protein